MVDQCQQAAFHPDISLWTAHNHPRQFGARLSKLKKIPELKRPIREFPTRNTQRSEREMKHPVKEPRKFFELICQLSIHPSTLDNR
jgi:hypothetical protein